MSWGKSVVNKTNHGWRQYTSVLARIHEKMFGLSFEAPTLEEYLARKAGRRLVDITVSAPVNQRKIICRTVALNLIKKIYEEEKNYKQALEMWRVFHRIYPEEITRDDRPLEP